LNPNPAALPVSPSKTTPAVKSNILPAGFLSLIAISVIVALKEINET